MGSTKRRVLVMKYLDEVISIVLLHVLACHVVGRIAYAQVPSPGGTLHR